MATPKKTSASHPIRVDWLPLPWPGRVGLTFAPGKKQPSAASGNWDRDLAADLDRLRTENGAHHLVSLVEDAELHELGINELMSMAEARGIAVRRFPIRDGSVPQDVPAAASLVRDIVGWAASGENVVIHCKGGLGRAGTIGGCVLRASGTAEAALNALHAARGPSCPETHEQEQFIRAFAAGPPSPKSRALGAVLGAAIGDAMGHPTEFPSMVAIKQSYGFQGVQGFELWWDRAGQHFAPYTDDTQMAEIVLRGLLSSPSSGGLDAAMETIAAGFVQWIDHPQGGHRAPGTNCMAGARALAGGAHWAVAGGAKAGGCGSVMRAYPFGLLFAGDLEKAERWAVQHSKFTHRAPIAFAACAAMAVGIARTLGDESVDDVLTAMIEAAGRHESGTAAMIERAILEAASGVPPSVTLDRLRGWAAHEAIAAAAYVVARHPADARAAILEGANTPGDSDSIATLAGALVGARTGLEGLPTDWVRDVERSSELLALAKAAALASGLR